MDVGVEAKTPRRRDHVSGAKEAGEANTKGDALRSQTNEDSLDAESQAKMRIAG